VAVSQQRSLTPFQCDERWKGGPWKVPSLLIIPVVLLVQKYCFPKKRQNKKAPSFSFIIQKISTFVAHNNNYQRPAYDRQHFNGPGEQTGLVDVRHEIQYNNTSQWPPRHSSSVGIAGGLLRL
jgi:hypothetical protein